MSSLNSTDSFAKALQNASSSLGKTLNASMARVEDLLQTTLKDDSRTLQEPISYLLRGGGKRARPLLTLLCAELGSGINSKVIQGAAVIEMIHLGSLYHDDVMDNAEYRRGRQAAHLIWGNSAAILAGDVLFARANLLGLELGTRCTKILVKTFERLVTGQLMESLGLKNSANPTTDYIQILKDKTGSLIAASAEIGLCLGDAAPELAPSLAEFGESLGVAFQLIDDVIDLSDHKISGKSPGTDLKSGVLTMPRLLLQKSALTSAEDRRLLEAVNRVGPNVDADRLEEIIKSLRKHPVTEQTLKEAKVWGGRAKAALKNLPKGPVRQALGHFIDSSISRRS